MISISLAAIVVRRRAAPLIGGQEVLIGEPNWGHILR